MEQGMFIIAGLGNPGKEYEDTRHNVGFRVLEKLAKKENISVLEKRHKAIIGKGVISGRKCILAKPQTYMNLSGESVRELVNFYKVDEKAELIVISDDISLEPGQIRIRKKGSAGGHNGLKNIIANLGHDTFIRVKMGVGEKPAGWDLADYVLGRFSPKDREAVDQAADRAVDAICMIIAEGADAAMNRFNGSPKDGGTSPKGKSTVKRDGSRSGEQNGVEESTESAREKDAAERAGLQSEETDAVAEGAGTAGENIAERDAVQSGEQGTAAEGLEPAKEKNAAQGSPSEGRGARPEGGGGFAGKLYRLFSGNPRPGKSADH